MVWFRIALTGAALLVVLYFQFFYDFKSHINSDQENAQVEGVEVGQAATSKQ